MIDHAGQIPVTDIRAAAGPREPLLRLHDVGVTFAGVSREVVALEGITIDIGAGEFVAIVGPSGSGKTTLLRIIDGLLPLSRGEIWLRGVKVQGPGRDRGFVFQSDCLLPWRTIIDNVGYGLELNGVPRRQARETAMDLLRLTGLEGCERQYPAELSGGMRQRANLARALAIDPEVLLMDEPFAALDAQTRDDLQMELQSVAGRIQATVLFVTHNVREAVILGDRVVVMSKSPGRIRRVIAIPLGRMRTPDDHDVADYAAMVRAELQDSSSDARPRYAI